MKRLLAENMQEFLEFQKLNEEEIDEGALDFFKSARGLVKQALKDPNNEENVNKAIGASFAKQFGNNPKVKEAILKWDLAKKQELLKIAAKKLEDPKVGILTLSKDRNGKLIVLGAELAGGASHSTTGA